VILYQFSLSVSLFDNIIILLHYIMHEVHVIHRRAMCYTILWQIGNIGNYLGYSASNKLIIEDSLCALFVYFRYLEASRSTHEYNLETL